MHSGPEPVHEFSEGVQVAGRVHVQGYRWRLWARSAERAGGQEASTRAKGAMCRGLHVTLPLSSGSGEGV